MPLGDGVIFVSVADPGGGLGGDCLLVGDLAIETLRDEDAEFGFGQVDYVGLEQARAGGERRRGAADAAGAGDFPLSVVGQFESRRSSC